MSEKIDGIRAYWNGYKLISRHSKDIACPQWFKKELSKNVALDGELWLGRGTFELLNGLINTYDMDNTTWNQVSYMVFDLPQSKLPYQERVKEMGKLKLPKHVQLLEVKPCKSKSHLYQCLEEVLEHGGEGLMLNEPNSFYVAKRTDKLLKVKVNFSQFL
jgi:DNA ligase-1